MTTTKLGRYSVNAAAAEVYCLDSNATYNVRKGTEVKNRGRWYFDIEDAATGERFALIPRAVLFDRWNYARKQAEARQEAARRAAQEAARRAVNVCGVPTSIEQIKTDLAAAAQNGGLSRGWAVTVAGLLSKLEELLDAEGDC